MKITEVNHLSITSQFSNIFGFLTSKNKTPSLKNSLHQTKELLRKGLFIQNL